MDERCYEGARLWESCAFVIASVHVEIAFVSFVVGLLMWQRSQWVGCKWLMFDEVTIESASSQRGLVKAHAHHSNHS